MVLMEHGFFAASADPFGKQAAMAAELVKGGASADDVRLLWDRAQRARDPGALWATWLSRGIWKQELTAARRGIVQREHIHNMPRGASCCHCAECVAYRSGRP